MGEIKIKRTNWGFRSSNGTKFSKASNYVEGTDQRGLRTINKKQHTNSGKAKKKLTMQQMSDIPISKLQVST